MLLGTLSSQAGESVPLGRAVLVVEVVLARQVVGPLPTSLTGTALLPEFPNQRAVGRAMQKALGALHLALSQKLLALISITVLAIRASTLAHKGVLLSTSPECLATHRRPRQKTHAEGKKQRNIL